jgi:carbonic anhydrase/acetyltransferase-like protein (isoleucine patch superfamily)
VSGLPPVRMLAVGDAFVASTASVLGDVRLARDVNVWFGAVVRGDDAPLSVGERSNLQDRVVMHADTGIRNDVGEDVTVGHGAILHGTRVESYALIGMGAVLLGRSVVGEGSIVGAGAVVTEGTVVPPYSLVLGLPGKVVRALDPGARKADAIERAREYVAKARDHIAGRWGGGEASARGLARRAE